MEKIVTYIKRNFTKSENSLMKLILAHLIVFFVINVFSLCYQLGLFYTTPLPYLVLPSKIAPFLAQWWGLFTYPFAYGSGQALSLLGNLLFLYLYGRSVVHFLGNSRLPKLYLLGTLGGGVSFLLAHQLLPILQHNTAPLMGSSPAIYAIMAAVATFAPNYPIFPILLPAGGLKMKHIVGFNMIWTFIELAQGDISKIASLTASLLGFGYVKLMRDDMLTDGKKRLQSWGKRLHNSWWQFKHRTKLVKGQKPTSTTGLLKRKKRANSKKEVAIILDKVAKHGYQSLTEEEKQTLFEA
jgi:membrane associated rhomboid family serine protease